jgi:capsular polysaccharide biosynthesis protein
MAKDAREHYAAASPCPPGYRDVPAKWVRMVDWCKRTSAPIHRMLDAGIPAHRPSIASLTDVLISPAMQWAPILDEGRVALSDFMMQRVKLRTEDPDAPLLLNRTDYCELRLPVSPQVIDTEAVLIGGMNQYYHNTVEMLSALAVVESLAPDSTMPLVVNDDLGAFQLEQLSLLGYDASRLIKLKSGSPVMFRSLAVPSRLVRGGQWVDPLVPQWYRRRLVTPAASETASRKLYLSRAGVGRRKVANEEALVEMLVGRGFEVVRPETLSVRDQVALFSRASHIVGATGAALTNMLFAPPGTHVVTLFNSHFANSGGDRYFDAIAKACGHHFLAVHCVPATVVSGQRVIDSDLVADLEAVRAALG